MADQQRAARERRARLNGAFAPPPAVGDPRYAAPAEIAEPSRPPEPQRRPAVKRAWRRRCPWCGWPGCGAHGDLDRLLDETRGN